MSKIVHRMGSPLLSQRAWRIAAALGLAASVVLALTGSGSAVPPDPCFF